MTHLCRCCAVDDLSQFLVVLSQVLHCSVQISRLTHITAAVLIAVYHEKLGSVFIQRSQTLFFTFDTLAFLAFLNFSLERFSRLL